MRGRSTAVEERGSRYHGAHSSRPRRQARRPPRIRPAPRPAAPGPGGLGRYVWPALCLVQLGLIGGWLFTHFHTPAAPKPEATEPGDKAGGPAAPGEAPTVERGDELMQEGRYDLALKVYEPLAGTASGPLRDALQYRVALCQEGLGRGDPALQAYRAVAGRTENPRAAAAAEVGQARLLIRQRKPAEAKNLLYPLLLRSGTPDLRDQAYLGDARYLLALTLTLEVLNPEKPGPLSDALADYAATDWPVEAALDWVAAAKEPAPDKPARPADTAKEAEPSKAEEPGQGEKAGNYVVVRQTGQGPEQVWVSAAVPQGTLAGLIDRLAAQARLKVEWAESARKVVADRGAAVAFENLPLADVLLALTDPLGLLATVKDDTLRLATEAETPPEAVAAYRAATAKRALNNAVASNPGHRLTAAAFLELGNLEARAGRPKEAAGRYERLNHEFRRSPLLVESSYNLGVVRLKQGQTAEARAAFYAARDHAPGHELAPLALLQVGRTFLLEGAAEQAVKPLNDALAVSAGGDADAAGGGADARRRLLAGEQAATGGPGRARAPRAGRAAPLPRHRPLPRRLRAAPGRAQGEGVGARGGRPAGGAVGRPAEGAGAGGRRHPADRAGVRRPRPARRNDRRLREGAARDEGASRCGNVVHGGGRPVPAQQAGRRQEAVRAAGGAGGRPVGGRGPAPPGGNRALGEEAQGQPPAMPPPARRQAGGEARDRADLDGPGLRNDRRVPAGGALLCGAVAGIAARRLELRDKTRGAGL